MRYKGRSKDVLTGNINVTYISIYWINFVDPRVRIFRRTRHRHKSKLINLPKTRGDRREELNLDAARPYARVTSYRYCARKGVAPMKIRTGGKK